MRGTLPAISIILIFHADDFTCTTVPTVHSCARYIAMSSLSNKSRRDVTLTLAFSLCVCCLAGLAMCPGSCENGFKSE
jgi:hypothetical protein